MRINQRSRQQIFLPFFQLDNNFGAWVVSLKCVLRTSYSTHIKAHILLRIPFYQDYPGLLLSVVPAFAFFLDAHFFNVLAWPKENDQPSH